MTIACRHKATGLKCRTLRFTLPPDIYDPSRYSYCCPRSVPSWPNYILKHTTPDFSAQCFVFGALNFRRQNRQGQVSAPCCTVGAHVPFHAVSRLVLVLVVRTVGGVFFFFFFFFSVFCRWAQCLQNPVVGCSFTAVASQIRFLTRAHSSLEIGHQTSFRYRLPFRVMLVPRVVQSVAMFGKFSVSNAAPKCKHQISLPK